jgi:hypothetical protein
MVCYEESGAQPQEMEFGAAVNDLMKYLDGDRGLLNPSDWPLTVVSAQFGERQSHGNDVQNKRKKCGSDQQTQTKCPTTRHKPGFVSRRGVCWNKCNNKWLARIKYDGKDRHLGYFEDKEEAARAYDKAARARHGDEAQLNFPGEGHRGPKQSSSYRGVSLVSRYNKWQAQIKYAGKKYHLGYFDEEEEAARTYDRAARARHGGDAKLNFSTLAATERPNKRCRGEGVGRLCEHEGCEKVPAYGSRADEIPRLCIKHKGAHHVNVLSKVCRHEGCEITPAYGSKEDGKLLFCFEHKHADHVDLVNKTCRHEGCEIQPYFGSKGDRTPLYCHEHKQPGNVDVKHKGTCTHDACDGRAYWGKEEQDLVMRCAAHKEAGDIRVENLRCVEPSCKGPRSFGNLVTDGVGMRCKEHKQAGDVRRYELRIKMRMKLSDGPNDPATTCEPCKAVVDSLPDELLELLDVEVHLP